MSESASGILVTMRHLRQAKLCAAGARRWFAAREPGLFATFRLQGLPVEWFEGTGDALALQVAAVARADHAGVKHG